ncbi:protein kinase [Ruminococcus sp. OA3]|uniref:serine/threonine protein kinase n=1 Tax=Ruminococcus sp. OA3 TaxID=2914164 RepID=UPI001F06C930|nr:protein kinase [Ruminococcus sp. OA3]MCH1983890.1 protein kinase [Ruminococcus sp. OA3]
MEQLNIEDGICPACGKSRWEYRWEQKYLKPYTVLQEKYLIGAVSEVNASGTLYAACDLVLDQRLSVMESETEDPEDFLGKAGQLFGSFDILGLAAVKDYFVRETKGYLVMEDLTQGSLRTAMEKKQLPEMTPDELVKLFQPALEACTYLHSHGMIHGEITAGHLFFDQEGDLKLIGFQAKMKAADETMAPEQCQDTKRSGPWTDVYRMCAVLYEILTGRKVPAAAKRLRKDSLRCMPDYIAVAPDLDQAVMQGLELEMKKRFFSPALLMERLGLDAGKSKRMSGAVQKNWGDLWLKIATEGEQFSSAKKRIHLERRIKKRIAAGVGAVILCIGLGVLGLRIYCKLNPGRVLDYKLEQVRKAALPSTERQLTDMNSEDYTKQLEFVKENANEIKEYDWSVWYMLDRQAAVKWKRTSDEYAKFYLDKDTLTEAFGCRMQLSEERMSSEVSGYQGNVVVDKTGLQTMTVMCRETETHRYPGWEHLEIIYDVVDEHVFSVTYRAKKAHAIKFLTSVLSDICPETYLTEEEASGLIGRLTKEENSVSLWLNAKCRLNIFYFGEEDSADSADYYVTLGTSTWML